MKGGTWVARGWMPELAGFGKTYIRSSDKMSMRSELFKRVWVSRTPISLLAVLTWIHSVITV